MAHLVSQEELCDEFEMFGDQLDTPEVIEKCKRNSIRQSGKIFGFATGARIRTQNSCVTVDHTNHVAGKRSKEGWSLQASRDGH